jgi:hypothetical protein
MVEPSSFWESLVGGNCIYHAIMPTVMHIKLSVKPITLVDCENDEEQFRTYLDTYTCVYCKTNMCGKECLLAVRILIGNFTGGGICLYHCRVFPSTICVNCRAEKGLTSGTPLLSNAEVTREMFHRLEVFARRVGCDFAYKKMDGDEFWGRVLTVFEADRRSFFRAIGKLDNKCAFCKKTGGKLKRCSSCHLNRYCDTACSHAHWAQHKAECLIMVTCKLFFDAHTIHLTDSRTL